MNKFIALLLTFAISLSALLAFAQSEALDMIAQATH